jgi:hypothetical protein
MKLPELEMLIINSEFRKKSLQLLFYKYVCEEAGECKT